MRSCDSTCTVRSSKIGSFLWVSLRQTGIDKFSFAPNLRWQSPDRIFIRHRIWNGPFVSMKLSKASKLVLPAGSLLLHFSFLVYGQECFYPNGDPAISDDHPCSLDGHSTCCPLNWQCLSNGLCYLEKEGYLGRYTCTDQTWESDKCPQICLYGKFPFSWMPQHLIVCQRGLLPEMRQFSNAARAAIVATLIVLNLDVAKPPKTSSHCQMGL